MATMRDVAVRAGVSIATVSFVVNGTKRVSPETRTRIESAMSELGFRRNIVARGLASGRTRIIALLFPAFDHRLGGTALSFVTSAANAAKLRDYNLVLWPVSNDGDQIADLIAGGLVDGVLLMEVLLDDARVDRVVESGIPFALIGRTRDPAGLPYVDIDFTRTIEVGLDHLQGLGHDRIVLVTEALDGSGMAGYGPVVRSEEAYRSGMEARGLRPLVVSCAESPEGGREVAARLVATAPDTTAVMVMNDDAAFGIVSGFSRAGWSVPADVSILSIVTTAALGAMADPVLSTMNAPGVELGRRGVEALIDQLEGVSVALPQLLIPCELQIRASTAPARVGAS